MRCVWRRRVEGEVEGSGGEGSREEDLRSVWEGGVKG